LSGGGADDDDARVGRLLGSLERMAGGNLDETIAISPAHDNLDAIGFGINVLVGELRYVADDLRRARDEADSANRAKTTFLRNISHEIRTPLSAILALTQLLAEPELPAARHRDLVGRVQTNARALLALVDDLLDLSKVEAGKLPFAIAPMAPLEVVRDVVRSLDAEAQRRGLALVMEAAAEAPATINSDARRVRQILMNIVGNALKFTAQGSVCVRLFCDHEPRLCIDVIDSGIGLTAEQQRALFVPFQQVDPAIAHTYGGTGLGLVLSKRFAEGLGGDVVLVASAPGTGSTFRITLRSDLVPSERALEAASRAPRRAPRPLAGRRVLLAEDNPDIRLALADLLEFAGAQVVQAEGGDAAVREALAGPFDAVLMDVRMPDLDGLQATRILRARGCRLPIVALTADAMKEHRAECLAAGYDDYVAKPVEYPELIETVLRVSCAGAS
jgi:signal transduction histidine kinase